MTWALCFNCGDLKFGAWCACPECQVASTGDRDLDILFSDHNFSRETLSALGGIIQQIRAVCHDDGERFWAFMKYMADNYPEVLTLRLPEEYESSVTALLSSLCLPTIELKPPLRNRLHADSSKESGRRESQRPSNGSGNPLVRAPQRNQQGQRWSDGPGTLGRLIIDSGVKWVEQLETALQDTGARGVRAREGVVLLAQGDAFLDEPDARRAADCYEQALDIAREIGGRLLEEASLSSLGNAHLLLFDLRKAIECHEEALEIAREIGNRAYEGLNLGNLGTAYRHLGEASRAIELHEQALEIARETGDRALEANQLENLGTACRHSGTAARAVKFHEEALAIARQLGDRRHEGELLGSLGNDFLAQGDLEQANRYYENALGIARETGDREGEARWLGGLGNVIFAPAMNYHIQRVRLRDVPQIVRLTRTVRRAMALFEQAADIAHQVGDRRGEGAWLGNLGSAYHRLGRMRQAIPYYEQALVIAQEVGDRTNEAGWLRSLGNAYGALREPGQALEYYREALAVEGDAADPLSRATLLYNMGLRAKQAGDLDRAREIWMSALTLSESMALPIAIRVRRMLDELSD
jgi:tetratricopeptide (TPR) repeat protein